jgi:hypothetical protein
VDIHLEYKLQGRQQDPLNDGRDVTLQVGLFS